MCRLVSIGVSVALWLGAAWPQEAPVAVPDPSFETTAPGSALPEGWSPYGAVTDLRGVERTPTAHTGDSGLLIRDDDPNEEIGICITVPAQGGLAYRASVWVAAAEGASSAGAYMQLRFLPSNELQQRPLRARGAGFSEVRVAGMAPDGTEQITLYLYTHRAPTPRVIVDDVSIVGGVDVTEGQIPPPVPPDVERLKDLCLATPLIANGVAQAAIVTPASGRYEAEARRIAEAVREITSVDIPIVIETDPRAALPLSTHVICLGNRSTNPVISQLYDRHYVVLDLKYPGPRGSVVRSLHNPFGNGCNVLFAGGSDDEGVRLAVDGLIGRVRGAGGRRGELSVGWLMDIQLGEGYAVPTDIRKVETWDASGGYGSSGYFGWNMISKRMALYYMTGDPFHAREALRLAFPDEAAKQEIAEIDGEMIENKDAPLSGPYHYNAHFMILYWDLIEESPVFTDEERLRVTRAFAEQLRHRGDEGIYGLEEPPDAVGSRHSQWSAVSLYCLGRYMNTYYPSPVWAQCVRGATEHFAALHSSAYVEGETDNLFWYPTGIAPIFEFLTLTGDRVPVENGVVAELLRGQEALVDGVVPGWGLRYGALSYFDQVAHITGDGRWVHYRDRTGLDTNAFRVGQSFWPEPELAPVPPTDMVGHWSIQHLPSEAWASRGSGIPEDQSFYFASFRSVPDASGDYILLDGYNGASRNPYHTFAVLELRIGGTTILKSQLPSGEAYLNQVQTKADGLVEPVVGMDAALIRSGVIGDLAYAVGEVAKQPFCTWRRTLAQRVGRYALMVDQLDFRADAKEMEAKILVQTGDGAWDAASECVHVQGYAVQNADRLPVTHSGGVTTWTWRAPSAAGERRRLFTLIAPERPDGPLCARLGDDAVLLATPDPVLAVQGEHDGIVGDLVLIAPDAVSAIGASAVGLGPIEIAADPPVDLHWDLRAGLVEVIAAAPSRVTVGRGASVDVPVGRTSVPAPADPQLAAELRTALDGLAATARTARAAAPSPTELEWPEAPSRQAEWSASVGGRVAAIEIATVAGEERIFAAEGTRVHVLSPSGQELGPLTADGAIRVLRWWPEHELLLVGCVDEQVIAFRPSGERAWVFRSEMAPEVFRAAKQYWFKSAPGHEGIHGLHTGVFLNGETEAFVGSACTMEILGSDGALLHRLPVFWGPGTLIRTIDGANGTRDLLIARWPNDGHGVAAINSATLDPNPRRYVDVPPGHTYVGGWCCMDRKHLFDVDMDGDGVREIVGEVNGTWNRVTVWSVEGQALYAAHFGPGASAPARTIMDMDVADLDGDGRREILVSLADGLVLCLDNQCVPMWSRRMPGAPQALAAIAGGVLVGCADGTVARLSPGGTVDWLGHVDGAVEHLTPIADDVVVAVTANGSMNALAVDQ